MEAIFEMGKKTVLLKVVFGMVIFLISTFQLLSIVVFGVFRAAFEIFKKYQLVKF